MTSQSKLSTTNFEGDLQAALEGHLDRASFQAVLERVNWSERTPAELMQAIHVALQLELLRLAYRLADMGHQLFPDDRELSAAASVLAPPKILSTDVPAKPGLELSMRWLNENAKRYRGQWVAMKNGEFMGQAATRQALVDALGEQTSIIDIITRIP
ncbi:MAG: hypothetical protein BroJett018_52400 [Chloroflexota bacterium]|nr:MAG: hypothetical protein BroJett018_52400 [Chloroflexota bacterium]